MTLPTSAELEKAVKELIPKGTDLSQWKVSKVVEVLSEKFGQDLKEMKKEIKDIVVRHIETLEEAEKPVPKTTSDHANGVKTEDGKKRKLEPSSDVDEPPAKREEPEPLPDSSVVADSDLKPYVPRRAAVKAAKLNKKQADHFGSTKRKAATEADGESKPKKPRKQNTILLSEKLAEFLGTDRSTRGEVTKAIIQYVKDNDLQNPKDRREIICDDALFELFKKKKTTYFKMQKLLVPHMKSSWEL